MNRSLVPRLVAKDLYLYRWLVAASLAVGFASIPLMRFGGDMVRTGVNLGVIVFMTDVIALGIFIVMLGLFKERQDRSLVFVLSLPVSPMQHAVAKVAAALVAFLVPWLVLGAAIVALIAGTAAPDGGIPPFVATMAFFLANFCVLLALVLATRSEAAAIAGILVTNVSVPAVLGMIMGLPGIAAHREADAAAWSGDVVAVVVVSLVVSVASIALALLAHSRRKDFV